MIINLNSLALTVKIKVPQEFRLMLTFHDFMILMKVLWAHYEYNEPSTLISWNTYLSDE